MQRELSETLLFKEEQIATFLNLEESDLGSDGSSFDFSDDELYEDGADADIDEEVDDEDEDEDEDELVAALLEDDFYLDDPQELFGAGFVGEEEMSMIVNLTGQLKNKREASMLKLALTEQRPQATTTLLLPTSAPAATSAVALPAVTAAEVSSFYMDFAPITPGVVPSSIHTPLVSSDDSDSDAIENEAEREEEEAKEEEEEEEEEVEEKEEVEVEEAKRASSISASDSDSDIDVDVEEVDMDMMVALLTPRPNKRCAKYIEEEDSDDSDSDTLILSRSTSPLATPASVPRGRHLLTRFSSSRPSSSPASAPTSRQSSRASSPAPTPSRNGRVPTQAEESLIFKIQHLLPPPRQPEVRQLIEKITGSRCEEFAIEIPSLSAPRFKEVSDFVQACIQDEVSAKKNLVEELVRQEPPSTPQSVRVTRSRKEEATPHPFTDSPLHTATSKPLPTTYVATPTTRTKAAKKQRKDEDEEEIDILGF